jgi:hypothetical protein
VSANLLLSEYFAAQHLSVFGLYRPVETGSKPLQAAPRNFDTPQGVYLNKIGV